MDQPLIYNKLVRDLVPQKIAQSGKFFSTSLLNDTAFADALRIKLIEEAHELFHADTREAIINESADLLELINAIIEMHGISWDEVVSRQAIKRQEVGAFNKRQMLHSTASNASGIESRDMQMHLPQLLTFNTVVGLVDIIKREILDASALHIATAFYSRGILNLLLDAFRDFVRRGGRLRLLTSVMGNFNNPLDFQHLSTQIPEIEIRVFYPLNSYGVADFSQEPPPFHIKSFLFEKPTGQHSIIVGSSNLTGSGLSKNHEWNYFSNSETNLIFSSNSNLSAFQYALIEFENYWRDSSVLVDERFKNAYLPRWKKAHELRVDIANKMDKAFQKAIEPRPAQIAALKSLAERRNKGVAKTTVIAATGLGKTFLSAFDFMQSAMKNVLFIAHRENILNKSLEAFQTVDINFSGEILSGSSKPAHKNGGSLFAMVQTISQPVVLEEYAVDAFDYIVIDEFHHAYADSYQRVLEKFRPRFLLGLTATPERMDGRDVLKICNNDIAFETRLFDAIENRWLVPFQYFAIYDPTDYSALRWTTRGYVESELDAVLMHDTRAELVFNNLCKFLPSTGKIKALAFCSSRSHAEYMNRKFNALGKSAGIASVCLLGKNNIEEREQAMRLLQDENEKLQIICSVDIFGEGVDIPAVSHVLFLRPTQSFTVFLQQLGRGLRQLPEKEFLVVLDFVGNFKQSYVAQLALQGYHSSEDYRKARRNKEPEKQLPAACYVSVDKEVQRIRGAEIELLLKPTNRIEALKELYLEMRTSLGKSPDIMDFFANPAALDPYVFLKEKKLGGNWLRVKSFMEDLSEHESSFLGTPAEHLLQHLEKELSPSKSYKMVVLKSLLTLGGVEWSIMEIARPFLNYYLENRDRLSDWDELNMEAEPAQFPISKVVTHLIGMPLKKLVNTGGNFFELNVQLRSFRIKKDYQIYWNDSMFQALVADRAEFGLARYFYRKDRNSVVAPNMRGFTVEVPYNVRSDSGFAKIIRNTIADNPASMEWKCDFGTKGYSARMDIEIQNDNHFVAWTHVRYDDLSRFPARIKATATALYREGQRGEFHVSTDGSYLTIKRK